MKKLLRKLSMALMVVMVMSAFAIPAAAGQENGRGRRNVPTQEIQHLDAEVRVVAGQPVITVETKRGHVDISFALSGDVLVQGNGVVVQTEDESVVVPLDVFEVAVVDGQAMLVAEINPFLTKLVAVVVVVAVLSFTRSCASRVGENIGNRIISPVTP